jgi:hypothetical protein
MQKFVKADSSCVTNRLFLIQFLVYFRLGKLGETFLICLVLG